MNLILNRTRAPFSEEQDYQLCRFIALRIPVKEAGGRTGAGIYKELEQLVSLSDQRVLPDIY